MWHVLNVNRRLEAAEATIQGMTSLIDDLASELMDVKDMLHDMPPNGIATADSMPTNAITISTPDTEPMSPTLPNMVIINLTLLLLILFSK